MQHHCTVAYNTNQVAVLDDFVDPDLWGAILCALERERLSTEFTGNEYSRVWDWTGTPPFSSCAYRRSEPVGDREWPSRLFHVFDTVGKLLPGVLKEPWDDIRVHLQAARRGVKLNWHLDSHCVGAFTWYAHRTWKAEWGGELFLPDVAEPLPLPKHACFSEGFLDKAPISRGVYFAPIPNRCIVLAPGVLHGVARIDQDAGDAVRLAVVGFLTRG